MLLSQLLGVDLSNVSAGSNVAAALRSQGVAHTTELSRVLALPRRTLRIDGPGVSYDGGRAWVDATVLYSKGPCGVSGCRYCADGGPRLRPIQSAMLIEAAAHGLFAHAGIGQGKTLASLLFHDALGVRRSVLFVPPQLRAQLLQKDEPELRTHFHLPPVYSPWLGHGLDNDGIYVLGYSELSATDASDLLDQIRPELIVADEAHNFRHKDSARTRRFLRYMRHNPCRFIPLTATPFDASITDAAHLSELALGAGSPFPMQFGDLVSWSDAIDHEGEPGHMAPGALSALCEPGESLRSGFRRRLFDTPGVVSTSAASCDAKMEIRLVRSTLAKSVQDALAELRRLWAWDGQEFSHKIEMVRVARHLAQGFFYRLVWPGAPDQEWLEARNAWARAMRQRLTRTNIEGMDSPALLEAAAERGEWCPPEWAAWVRVRDRVRPGREAVELDRGIVQEALEWSSAGPGIVWADSPVVGSWLQDAGIPWYGQGSDSELLSADHRATIACSIKAHGTGKNLQAWHRNLVLYPPASALTWQQLIGRTHRPGQRSSTVSVDIRLPCDEAEAAFESALRKSEFIQATTGEAQRLLLGEYV